MSVVLVTGSLGLIGSECVDFFSKLGFEVIGIDNDMRKYFFGQEASTRPVLKELQTRNSNYRHHDVDIRDYEALKKIFVKYGQNLSLIIHTAAQPSHDWAAREPLTDFQINSLGTLHLLELVRFFSPDSVFIFTSTNKVYGDKPNSLSFIELESRWDLEESHPYYQGLPETFPIDQSLHSLFGCSKLSADILVQEYGRYFHLQTACFRGGCLTGPRHKGTQLHGFLAYLMKCVVQQKPYTIFGYQGKQVRDNIHSLDLVRAFYEFFKKPKSGAVYNIGGGRFSNCSMLEAIQICEQISQKKALIQYRDENRMGDHKWWISDLGKFQNDYPDWKIQHDIASILQEIYELNRGDWKS